MIHTIPTFHFHLKTDVHVRASITTTTSSTLIALRDATSHSYGGCGSVPTVGGNSNRRVLQCNNPTVVVATAAPVEIESASNVVRKFYEGINRRDLVSVENLIALNCIYDDLVFPQPFVGRKAILEFFKQFSDSISADLQFAIDDISAEDASAVGVTWHLEWKGKPFPFSKGCSFYRLNVVNGQRQIVYGRDIVEPAIKPGETALVVIRGVTWLLQKFPFLADRL